MLTSEGSELRQTYGDLLGSPGHAGFEFDLTQRFTSLRCPRAVSKDLYRTVDAFGYESQTKSGVFTSKGFREVEILVPDDGAIGVVDHTIGVVTQSIWGIETVSCAIACLDI